LKPFRYVFGFHNWPTLGFFEEDVVRRQKNFDQITANGEVHVLSDIPTNPVGNCDDVQLRHNNPDHISIAIDSWTAAVSWLDRGGYLEIGLVASNPLK